MMIETVTLVPPAAGRKTKKPGLLVRGVRVVGDVLDNCIEPILPGWAVARRQARMQAGILREVAALSTYEAAEKSRTTDNWGTTTKSADQAILPDLSTVTARASAAMRDDGTAASIRDAFVRHVVGIGITRRAKARDPVTDEYLTDFNKRANRLFDQWARKPKYCDAERKKSLVAIQGLMVKDWLRTGGGFCAFSYVPRANMVGLVLQPFEIEQLDRTRTQNPDTQFEIRNGIELDEYGAALAYWVQLKKHPLEHYGNQPERIPAERVKHFTVQDRVRETHGMTRLAPVLRELWHKKMGKEYTLLRFKMEACGGAAISRAIGSGGTPGSLQGAAAPPGTTTPYLDDKGNVKLRFEPNMIWDLGEGAELQFSPPSTPNSTYEAFMRTLNGDAAAGAGLDYNVVARDYSKGTFSNQRQAMLELWLESDPLQQQLINQFLSDVGEQWTRCAILEGRLPAPNFYDSPDWTAAYLADEWRGQPKYQIDPAKAEAARKIRLDNRLSSHSSESNELGVSWRDTIDDISDDEAYAAEKKVKLPSASGAAPAAPQEPKPRPVAADPVTEATP